MDLKWQMVNPIPLVMLDLLKPEYPGRSPVGDPQLGEVNMSNIIFFILTTIEKPPHPFIAAQQRWLKGCSLFLPHSQQKRWSLIVFSNTITFSA